MKITYYGHSTFLINAGGKDLLFDPYISPNERASAINVEEIPADFILLSHGHEDHIADAESIAGRTGATIISGFEVTTWFGGKGLNGHPLNHGGGADFEFGHVKYVNAVHSSNFPDGTYAGNPGGFVINTEEKSFYYSGDTALTYDMKLIPESGTKLDFAFLCIGDNFTMGPEDAARAAGFIQCNNIIGMHYDTFGFIEIDHEKAINTFSNAGAELTLMEIGQTIDI
ncbi:MAG: metal-dependent hydrolase [Bacteroidetes bacterium]|nr:metal-dependent hydrolase [Bacteroidota bacterium]